MSYVLSQVLNGACRRRARSHREGEDVEIVGHVAGGIGVTEERGDAGPQVAMTEAGA